MEKITEQLFHLLERGTSPAAVVREAEGQLKEAGFQELLFNRTWGLTENGKYYVKHHDTTLFAFTIGEWVAPRGTIRIAAAHTDFPCLRIKPNPDIAKEGYYQVNVEVYGGAILNTWLDRPLSISGRVALQSEDVMHPWMRYLSIDRPLMVIPNLAPHMNPDINKGIELNKQTHMVPVFGLWDQEEGRENRFMHFLAEELGVEPETILDFELWAYCMEKPQHFGIQEEFVLSPRLDNLTSVQAILSGLTAAERKEGINVAALFDHEEVGSRTKQGAGSLLLMELLEKINDSFGRTAAQTRESLYDAFLLSVDVAHGTHPNWAQKMDLTNRPVLGKGVCIKEAGAQSYATDCEAAAAVEQICIKEKIPYQKFVNRSDLRGGGTLGAVASGLMPIKTVDIGIPLLAMHSAVETMGARDMKSLTDLVTSYYQV